MACRITAQNIINTCVHVYVYSSLGQLYKVNSSKNAET